MRVAQTLRWQVRVASGKWKNTKSASLHLPPATCTRHTTARLGCGCAALARISHQLVGRNEQLVWLPELRSRFFGSQADRVSILVCPVALFRQYFRRPCLGLREKSRLAATNIHHDRVSSLRVVLCRLLGFLKSIQRLLVREQIDPAFQPINSKRTAVLPVPYFPAHR